MDEYVLTRAQFDSLAGGYGSTDAIDLLIDTQHARRRLLLLAAVESHDPLRSPVETLSALDRRTPSIGRYVFGHPYLEAWFADLTGGHEARATQYLCGLVMAAALRAGEPFELDVPMAGRDLVLPGLGTVPDVGPGAIHATGEGTQWTINARRRRLRPFRSIELPTIDESITMTLDDGDPYRSRFASPAASNLDDDTAKRFRESAEAAWRILLDEQPVHASTMRALLRIVVPLGDDDPGVQRSASARDAFGAVGLSVPNDPETLAELLIHELQHAKLGALLDLTNLCRPGGAALFYAPWRHDRRRAGPLLQGIYAYVGVSGYWRKRRTGSDHDGEFKFAYWRDQTAFALDQLLASDELTELGVAFATRLRRTLTGWQHEPVSAAAAEAATAEALADRSR